MYNSSGLIPARFIILICHFIVCVTLLWNSEESTKICYPKALREEMEEEMKNSRTRMITGLSGMLVFLCLEMGAFLIGLTMFNSNSTLLSITVHALACIFLTGLVLNGLQCGWMWWIYSFIAALPLANDMIIYFLF